MAGRPPRLTRQSAESQAQQQARKSKQAVEVWEHVGGSTPAGRVAATGRLLVRRSDQPAPKWGVWQKVSRQEP